MDEEKTLKLIALDRICINLSEQRQICTKNSWKIPTKIGDLIFNHYFKSSNCFSINENHIKFFYKDITSLSKIKPSENLYKYLEFFMEIDKDGLEEIDDTNLISFKNFIEIITTLLKGTKNIKKLTLSCGFKTKEIYKLLENSKDKLTEINFMGVSNTGFCSEFLNSTTNLHKLVIKHYTVTNHTPFNLNFILFNSTETIREIDLSFIQLINDESIEILNKCKNLRIIRFLNLKNSPNSIRELMKNFHNPNNYIIELSFIDLGEEFKLNFYLDFKFIESNFPNIEEINLAFPKCESMENYDISNLSQNVINLNNLTIIHLSKCALDNKNCRIFGNVLKNLKNLTTLKLSHIDFDQNCSFSDIFNGITLGLTCKLKELFFEYFSLNENDCKVFGNILCFLRIKCLFLRSIHIFADGIYPILDGLQISRETLTELSLIRCRLNEYHAKRLGETLIKINSLEKFCLNFNENIDVGVVTVFQGLLASKNTLKSINIEYCLFEKNITDGLLNFFLEFKRVEEVFVCDQIFGGQINITLINFNLKKVHFQLSFANRELVSVISYFFDID